jgi:hypothetical protein
MDAEIIRIKHEVVDIMLPQDLEAIIGGYTDADHGLIDDATDLLAICRVLAPAKIDTNEWHGASPAVEITCICLQWQNISIC